MELYLSACSKAANAAAAKTATSSLEADSQQCGDGAHRTHFPGVGAAQLLDLPLGVKLPMIPGSNTLYYTTKLSEKLFRPSYGFNLTDPYCRLMENQYKSLHDPHLRAYYQRKDILRRLKKGGYITSNNKIVCNLRELNKYRQYLTSLKLDFERNYIREQKMLAKQINDLRENNQMPGHSDIAQFQNWLLQEGTQSVKDQERLIRHRYLDMISRELKQRERTAEEQRLLRMDREERRQREDTRRKLSLRRKIEEEWKTKEMLLLAKIGEDVKREARIEEQRRRSREESDKKKQALLEKKMAYHLQKMQENGFKREEMEKNTFDYRGQDETHYESFPKKKQKIYDDIKLIYSVSDQKANKGVHESAAHAVHRSQSNSKNVKNLAVPVACESYVQDHGTEQKKDGTITRNSSICNGRGSMYFAGQTSPTRNFPRSSHSYLGSTKDEEINADWRERPNKRSSYLCESGHQAPATAQGIFPYHVFSNIQQNLLQNCLQEKVTSEELKSIIQNIMTWVVATVTSILYPAITKYEERLQNNTYQVSDDSVLSSDSSSFCSTCSEEFTYGSYTSATTKTFQGEPCAFAVDLPLRHPPTSLKPPSAQVETTVGKTYHIKGQSITSELKHNKTTLTYAHPVLRSCKSDSHLLASFETGTKISKDATTETDALESPEFSDQKAKAMNEIKNLKNIFVNFKCHLKGETELILEKIFQEIMSDLTQAIPSISSVTAEVFVDQSEREKRDLPSNVDISSVASEIVENMLEKLHCIVEKKCVEMFSQEDLSVDIKPNLIPSGDHIITSNEKPFKASVEPICDIAEDMVHAILQKLMTLAPCKQDKFTHLKDAMQLPHQQHLTNKTTTFLKKADTKKCSPEPDVANLTVKEEIQNLISNIFSQSSLVGYIEEVISTILGYVQTELKSERFIASEETVVLLQLLNDIFTQFHQEPVKADVKKRRCSRLRNLSDTEEKYRLTGTRLSTCPKSRKPFPPINVPGMVLYSEDDNEEIDKIVEKVLDSSFKDEKAKSQKQNPEGWSTKRNICFESKRTSKPYTKPASLRSKVAFSDDGGLKTELPWFSNKEILKKNHHLNKDILIFSQDQKYKIRKASENIVKSILTEILKDISSVPPGHLGSKTGKKASILISEKPQGLSHEEWMEQMFSESEINTVVLEVTDAVLNIFHKAMSCIPNTTQSPISSSVHHTSLDSSDMPHMVREASDKKPLKIWFDSEKKVKDLSPLKLHPEKPSLLKSEESEPIPADNITDMIINTVFKRLKFFIYSKLERGFKSSLAEQSSLKSQLSAYTTKVVNIVLHAIQKELELSEKNINFQKTDHPKSLKGKEFFTDTDNLESLVTSLSDDIMASPLLTCICEMLLSGHSDQSSISLPSHKPRPSTSYGSDNVENQNTLPSRQDKKYFHEYLATPCALHSVFNGKGLKENIRLQVVDSIGEALYEMLYKLIGTHPSYQPSCSKLKREIMNENQQKVTKLHSNIQLVSKTILEYILAKLCNVGMDTSVASSGIKAVSKLPDIDNLSFASIIEKMTKCTDIISSIVSKLVVQECDKEVSQSKAKTTAPVSSKTGSIKEIHPNKLKSVASDILNTVFAKLEGFANGNLETLDSISDGNKKSSKMDLKCESPSVSTDTHEELLQSNLFMHAKKVASTILKAIETELNLNSDVRTSIKTPPPENDQMIKNTVNLILESVSSDMFKETECEERGIETYRYRPTYGNFLPGGAKSDPCLEDAEHTEKEFTGERTSLREETKSDSPKQWVLERTLNKIEVKLKEPQKSPVVPIVRNILNEIFQGALVNQLNIPSLSYSCLSGIHHNVNEPTAQTSVQFIDKMMGPLVSEADVTIVADDVVRIVFHKLYSATMTQRNASKNSYKTITFSANVSFHEHTYGEESSLTMLNKNPCDVQSRFNVDEQAKVSIVEDIVQAILTKLKSFATYKVKSLFCTQINFTVPMALPVQQDKNKLSKTLSAKDLYSDDRFSCCSMDHIASEKTNSCQLSLNKLHTYATEVARKILQGIKHELDKETESPFLTHNIVVSEGIASQIVNTMLDAVSSNGKCGKNNSEKGINSDQQEDIIEKVFNRTDYRKVLHFQIQDTIEGILCDIYEKTLYKNNLSFATPTLKCSIAGKHSRANSEIYTEEANKIVPKCSVPKSDVILISNDIVNIVLHNLSSAVIRGIHAEDSTARLPLIFCDVFPQADYPQLPLMESKSESKTECFSSSRNLKSAYAEESQINILETQDTKKSALDAFEENANLITKSIFNRLESFAVERIDSLISLAFQPKERSSVCPELENCKSGDSIFHESSQMESNVNVLKMSTENFLSQEPIDSTFASYREQLGSTIHLSQTSLKEYADIIASVVLKLIKNDLDLEIQRFYPNNILFQENIIVREIINSILKCLCDKQAVKEISFYSKDIPNLFSQLTVSNELLPGRTEQEKNTKLSLLSKNPLEENRMALEKESQRIVLEEVFMRNRESNQKGKTALLSAVEKVLNKVYQRMETIGLLPSFNEIPYLVSNSKIKISDITHKNLFQSHINNVAKDIVESVLGKMYSIVVTSLYESNKKQEASDNNNMLAKNPSCVRETKQAEKGSTSIRHEIPQFYPYAGNQNVSLLENSFLQYSPLQVAKDLVQMVLNKITNFVSFYLEEISPPEDCPNELQPLSLHSFKGCPKDSPQPGFKASLKSKSKVTPSPKFRTKLHPGPSGAKAKSKTKLGPGEKTSKDNSRSKTTIGSLHILSTGDAKSLPETKLPTSDLKMYAKDIISSILETTVKEFEKVKQARAMVNMKDLPSDQIMAANEIVTTVLQGLCATKNHSLTYPIKFSHLDDLKQSQGNIGAGSLAKTQASFYLENVSSQLEQIFPKDGILKNIFDKWQAESNDMENEECKLLMIAENFLTKISVKAKELEYSLSFLNLPHLEDCENKFHNHFKGTSTRAENTKAEINMFGREIVEMLFEKLQLCFLSQVPTPDSKGTLTSKHITTKSKYSFPSRDNLSSVPIHNMKTKDHISLDSSKQIVQEIVERMLNILESFVDLQFKHISKYEFSEIVKTPPKKLFPVQQRLLSQKILPKLQPLKMFSDESKSGTIIFKENAQNALLQVHSFHSELLTYAVNIISDMLGIIKNKLDKEISQVEPSSINILKENIVASEIIGTLIDQCTYFNESLIKNLPMESLFQGMENIYIVNQVELATNMKMPTSKLKEVSFGNNPPHINVPSLMFYSKEDIKKSYTPPSNLSLYARASLENTIKSTEPMERLDSEKTSSFSRNKVQDHIPRESNFSHFDQVMKGSNSLPEDSVLQKLFKKTNESTEEALKQVMSFIGMEQVELPRMFHYETLKQVAEPDLTWTTVSPLKICLAAENIVNTVLSSYGFPGQPQMNENIEIMKPFFISKQIPEGQENEEKSLLGICDKRISCITQEEEEEEQQQQQQQQQKEQEKKPEAIKGDFSLLQKLENQRYPKTKTLKEFEVIAFADHEMGPNEINLVARHVTTYVIAYFKNFKTRVPNEEKVSIVSTLSKKKSESKQPLRNTYNDSLLYQFCEHLSESVICHLMSSISDSTKDGRDIEKAGKCQNAAFKTIISIDSQVFKNRSISIGDLALSVSGIITEILFNSKIIEPDIAQQIFSLKAKYIYCPGVDAADFDNVFQDLLIGVIHVLSKEIGITHHLESNGKNNSLSKLRSNSVPICNKTNTMERQTGCSNWESTYQTDHLIKKNKLNYLANKLDNIVGSLKCQESKQVVNKVFNIVLDLFLPDEHSSLTTDSNKKAKTFSSSSNDEQSNSVHGNNTGLTPKSVFLLNVVCEKLIRTLLEKYTNTVFLDDNPVSDEITAEEHHLFKILQNEENEEFDSCEEAMNYEQFQGECMSNCLENLTETDQDLLSSDSLLTMISHSLVKSLMDKLCHGMHLSQSPPFANKNLKYRTKIIQSNFVKENRPELAELGQGKGTLGFMSYDSNALIGPLNNPSVVGPKIQAPFAQKCSVSSSSASSLQRQRTEDMNTIAIHSKLYKGYMNMGIYSATFLEEIISELFFKLSTSLWGTNEDITETQLNEINTLFVNHVVNEFNNARVTVLRDAEERLCFPPVHKEIVSKIIDSLYYDVFQIYKLKVTCGSNLALDNASIAKQITNGILLEILDYQLPSCFRKKLRPNSYYPLKAEIILQKLQHNLREFTFKPRSSTDYSTMLSYSFLEGIIKKILSQLNCPTRKSSSEKKYFMSPDFNEMSTCIINKVISAISKHKIWFTIYNNQNLYIEKNLQKMVDSVYSNIVQMSDSPVSIQKSIVSRNPDMMDRIASFIIQEIIENHLQPFLCEEGLTRPNTPLDAISNMVHQVLSEVTKSQRPQTSLPLDIYSNTFVGEIVARILSKSFNPKHNTEHELKNMTQKIVKSINNHFDKAKTHNQCNVKQQAYPSLHTDIVDELVTSVYRNVLKQHGLDPEVDKESEDSEVFAETITNLIVAAISDYLLHPLLSGDLSSSYSISTAENIVQDIISNISKSTKPHQGLSPYNTLLPYTFLEDMIRVLLSRIFSSASTFVPNRKTTKDRPRMNFNEIASDIITDIRRKISLHEIRFSKDEEKTKSVYSQDDIQHLIDSVFKNISQNSEYQESVEQNFTSNDVLIDRIAGFIIKHVCLQHLQPFVHGKSLPSSHTYHDNERRLWLYDSVYSSTFLEDVISGLLSKIFHRVLGIVQAKSVSDLEDELFDKAEKLIYLIAEEFSKAQVTILENSEEQLCLPPVEKHVVKNIIDMVYGRFLQEYETKITPNNDFLNDIKTLAARITKIILAETFDFQIHTNLIGKLPFKSHSKLNTNVLIRRIQYDITKSKFQRQSSTKYSTMLSHTHMEKIITQLISQMNPLASRAEGPDTSQSDLSNTVIKLINETMSIISKHTICIIKHGYENQSMISEEDIQSMVDSIYVDLSHSNLYQSLTKDKKGISNIPISKIATFIIKEIFNHHLQSFLPEDKASLSAAVDQNYREKAIDTKQRALSFIVNSAVFLEEVISELLSKLLYAFSHNVLASENPDTVKVKITGIVTALVKSIVLEFTTSEILVADYIDDDICSSEEYKEMVQKTVNLIYEKILDDYKSLVHVYRAIQSDTICFGRKIYNLLLEEIYEYQMQSLISGELASSSYSSPKADNIIRNVLNVIMKDSHLPSCVTVLPHSLLEDMIYKLLVHIFLSTDTESDLKEEEVSPDCEFVDTASKLTDEIIKEISEHEIHLATFKENAESMYLEVTEKFVDSICDNIWKKTEFQAEVKKGADKKGGSFLSKIAGFIMKEILDYHLQPFLHGEDPSSKDVDHISIVNKPGKEKTQTSLYSATFLENVIVDLVHKFYSFPSITEDSKKKEMPDTNIMGLAIKFANSLIGEFRKSEIKVLPSAEEIFSFPPIDKETVDKISNYVYDQFIARSKSNEIQDDKSNAVIEMIAALAQKAISAFKIQPLFSGDWFSSFFSFLNPDNITQRIQHLPQKTSTEINRCLIENQLTVPAQSNKHSSLTLDPKKLVDSLEIHRGKMSRKKSSQTEETSIKKGDIQHLEITSITGIMKHKIVNLLSGSAAGVTDKKKENENKMGTSIQIHNENVSKVISPTTTVKSKDTQKPNLRVILKNDETEKSKSTSKEEKQGSEVHTQIPVAADDIECKEEIPELEINNEKKTGKSKENLLKNEDKPIQSCSLTSKVRNIGTITEKTEKRVTQKPNIEEGKDTLHPININEEQHSVYEHIQNVTENIYDNILEVGYSQESVHYSNLQSPPSDTAFQVIQEVGNDFAQSVSTKYSSLSLNKNLPPKKKNEENEKEREENKRDKERDKEGEREKKEERKKVKEIKNEFSKPNSSQYSPKSKPGIFPAKFLEDVITEMVNKLVFSTSPETHTCDSCQNVSDDKNQAELYDTAMQLIDSLLKELSEAQIKVFRPYKENQFFPTVDKVSSDPKVPLRHEELTTDEEALSSFKKITGHNMSHMHEVTKKPSLNKITFLHKMTEIDKTLVNKVVHSSVCSILREYKSQDSICKNIKYNGENLARRLTSAVINEIFNQPNLIFCDEVPVSACLPLESKNVVKKIQKVAQTASKECQTSSPYTIMLPHEFLENVISALLSKIFSTVSTTKAKTSEGNRLTEMDFLQMKLLSTITTEISKDKDLIIQYVDSLHPNDDEIIQLVAHSIYNNLFSQFGSQEVIQNCVANGCIILLQSIVDLVLREVAGNQLQNYFSGELTPHQCAEVDSVVENILKGVIQTIDAPQPQLSHAHILPYNVIEEITVKFLSRLLSMFPKLDMERPNSPETEMQNITSKILNSIQEFISKSKIKLIPPAKELPTVSLANNESIEKVVNSVYIHVLKHSGSHTSIFKDLMGTSNVLSDIIGFLMVKEISNSEFQLQVQEEVPSSELVLEAVKIMEKVVKIVDEIKSQEKPSSKKSSMLDATFLEEALALFLAKIVKLPSASSKGAKNLSKPELNKIASQLTKSVTAEISKSNISLVPTDPEEQFLNPESIEMISQVIDSIYSNVLQQSGSHEDLYYDIKGTNRVFPKKVASLIINEVSNFPLETDGSKNSNADLFGDLDLNRIVQKAQEHADKTISDMEIEESEQYSIDESPIKIVPYVGNKPIKIDPGIISKHLGVISIKTQPLEKLKMDCLKKTGHTIAEVRRASINGRSYSSLDASSIENINKERRISLNKMGRLDVKPLEAVCRNSFQNIRKPDITKVEILKDVQGKNDLIIRLVAHDIEGNLQNNTDEELTSDEDEVVLRKFVPDYCLEQLEDRGEITTKPSENKVDSPKSTASTNSLKKFLSLSKCCQPRPSANIEKTEAPSNHIKAPKKRQVKRAVTEYDMSTGSTAMAVLDSSWEKKPQHKKEEINITEPTHYFVHRIMSSSSYNQEDLISSAGETEDCFPDTCAKILKESSQQQKPEYSNDVQFVTIFEGNKNTLGSVKPSKEVISETPKSSISQQGSKILTKVSSAVSKVFSRTNISIFKSSSPPHPDEH